MSLIRQFYFRSKEKYKLYEHTLRQDTTTRNTTPLKMVVCIIYGLLIVKYCFKAMHTGVRHVSFMTKILNDIAINKLYILGYLPTN